MLKIRKCWLSTFVWPLGVMDSTARYERARTGSNPVEAATLGPFGIMGLRLLGKKETSEFDSHKGLLWKKEF